MTKLVICLLFFVLLTIQTVGQMNSDPAPGRSPGPPNKLPVANRNIRQIYKTNNISNKLKRHNADETEEISIAYKRKRQITTSATPTTVVTETTTTTKVINSAAKPLSITNDVVYDVDNVDINAVYAEIPTTINQIKKTSTYEESYFTTTTTTKTVTNITKSDTKASIMFSDTLVPCSDSSFSEFLNDAAVIEDLDTPQATATDESQQQQTAPRLNIDLRLEHDVFDTTTALGITCGLMYKVRLLSSLRGPMSKYMAHYSGEFLVETVSSYSGRERGSFVGHTLSNKLPISWFNNLQRYVKDARGNVQFSAARAANNNSNEQHNARMTANSKWTRGGNNASTTSRTQCPANKWRDSVKSHASGLKTNESTESLNLWLVNELCERDDIIELRVFFRAILELNRSNYSRENVANSEAQHVVFKKTFKYQLHKDCQLILREMSAGTLEYTALPLYAHDCLVYFPSYQNYQASSSNTNTPPPGILVNMERLNVPCNTGGYVRFSERGLNLCGKLEELPLEQRTYHFDVRTRAAVNFFKKPMFSLSYKLVDFCYNITASNETGDFYIQSRRRDSLECYFRLHLPYGNRILLRLIANNVSAIMSSTDVQSSWSELHAGDIFPGVGAEDDAVYTITGDSIDTQIINLTLSSLSVSNSFTYEPRSWSAANPMLIGTNQAINAQILGTASCRGLIIKVFEHDHAKWSHCVNNTQNMRAFLIESTSNTLSVHLYRAASELTNTRLPDRLNGVYVAHTLHSDSIQHALPTIYLSYRARPMSELAANCEFGWIAMQQFCITAIEQAVVWNEGEKKCAQLGGHLASVRNELQQKIVNDMLLHSPGYTDEAAYWVGGSDVSYEGDFRWNDGLQFQYTNWFPGWEQHGHYNKQPNDDGLSSQDCIELRRYFRSPPGVQTNRTPLTSSYMWNDRDCNAKNFMICEKAMSDESLLRNWINDCNKTVSLTKEHPRASIWSPSFPRQYPDNANCYTTITAPTGYRIVIEFEELVIENEPGCTYDYLEISEPMNLEMSTRLPKSNKQSILNDNNKNSNINTVRKRNSNAYVSSMGANSDAANEYIKSYIDYDRTNVINKNTDASDNLNVYTSSYTNFNNLAQNNYQRLLHIFSSLYKLHTNFIIQTPDYPKGNPYFQHAVRGATSNEEVMPKRLCGDWSSKLKLLRYVSMSSYLGLHFVSDYSHHFGGYKAKTYMENTASECANERLKPYNGSCYLFVSYPEVDWWTAQQVCRAMGAKLSSVASADEHRFITSNIRNQIDYSPQLIYWLGAELEKNGQFEWTDDTKMNFQGWLPGQGQFDELPADATCLGLQWKMSPTPMLPSGLYWQSQKCNKVGGYVCKKPKESFGNFAFNNFTVTGTEGRLVSPAYPNSYPLNIDYWIHIKSPERTRIIVQFQKIDLEPQDECLYDFVSIQDYDSTIRLEPGTNTMPVAMYASEKWDAMLNESTDRDYFATVNYKRGNRLMKRLQHLQSRKRRRRRRRRRRRNINATEMEKVTLDHNKNTAILLQQKTFQIQQQQSYTIDRNTHGVAVPDRKHNDKNIKDKFYMKHIGNIAVKTTNENPKRRRRKRCITEIENKWPNNNKNHKRQRRSTILGDNGRSTADNAQTYLPYVRWCGAHDANMSKFDFVSRANEVVLNFHSDYSINGLGFAAVWKAIDISACPLQTLTSREGVLVSPNYPHFVLNNLNCAYVIQAPLGKRVWLEFIEFDLRVDALMEMDLGNGVFRPFHNRQHINEGIFVSVKEHLRVQLRTGQHPRGKGFQAVYQTLGHLDQRERVINLTSNATGHLYQLNYPHDMPENVDFIQHLVAPFGDNILLELHGVEFSEQTCIDNNLLEIYDNYADNNGTKWQLCKFPNANLLTETSDYDDWNDGKIDTNADPSDIIANEHEHSSGRSMERITHQHMRRAKSKHYNGQAPPVFITSYLNTLHIRQRSTNKAGTNLNATVRVQWDNNYKFKLATSDKVVESCQPNPCQHSGKCVLNNGTSYCQCQGHYTGRFCGLTLCELEPCVFGKCELTPNNFKCQCQPGYMGATCEQKQRPCAENPCEGRGICFERNGGFYCRCHAWWEGHRCERRMLHIPYKPLSERMLQEPFWLGLITVFVVMAVIGLVWCAKRHFPEKIEKLLAEEADRNRPPGTAHGHHHHTSLREQLQFTSAIPQPTAVSNAAGAQRSIFNRLGIRKPSLLSLSSPNPTPSGGGTAARTFSLDDLLRPPPRRSPSPRKKRNNSTPVKKNAADKNEILQQLVSPAAATSKTKVSLGELITMSENRLRTHVDSESDIKETTFSENSGSTGSAQISRNATDPKLEKKVTFARLLNKVSAEMSSGSEIDIGHMATTKNSSALSLPTDIQFRACSMPPSPCTNDLRSPHSTSSNQCSESLSSSDLALTDFGLRSMQNSSNDMDGSNNTSMIGLPLGNLATRYRIGMTSNTASRPKVSSADSILAMFRHMAIASAATTTQATAKIVTASYNAHVSNITGTMSNLPPPLITTSVLVSPTNTPTISSPQDDAPGDDESSTSSMYTPVSYSSGPTDSPIMYRHKATIEVPVLDVINAHKASSPVLSSSTATGAASNLLHPPTILLEIPNNGMNNKCLSPIRELPTPMPSPALTPVMPRPQRVQSPIFQDEPLYAGDYTDDEEDDMKSDDQSHPLSDIHMEQPQDTAAIQNCMTTDAKLTMQKNSVTINLNSQQSNMRKLPLLRLCPATPTMNSPKNSPELPIVPIITIDVIPATPEEKVQRPRDLIIPTLTVQQPSPTKQRQPLIIYPGSPPPQRASIGETSFMFPNKQQQKRLLKQFDKPTSLDFACEPPMITITANMSELESDDTEPLSPACKTNTTGGLMPPNPAGMCYLSPFTMCSRADRTISESNLSSSGYSSMASPGPSRCGSSNPLCPNEMDEPGSGHNSGATLPLHMNLMNRRKNAALASCKENIHNGQTGVSHATTHQQRTRSDSDTLSDDILLESNDEGIGTDHVDEKLEDTRLVDLRCKELNMFYEDHILLEVDEPPAPTNSSSSSSSSNSTAALISCTQQMPQLTVAATTPPQATTLQAPQQQLQQMSQLQLPSIVIQMDGSDKGFSSVSSRSESPLSERAGVGRFSPHFYGRKDLLPFTDSDGLYDFPSSDGKGASAPIYTHQRRSSSKKRDRKSSKCSTMQSPTKQQQLHEATAKENLNTTSSPSSCSITHACNKHCHSHHHPCPVSTINVPRKSPKRRIIRPPLASSSSSSESIASSKEIVMRPLPRRFNSPKRTRQQESLSEDEVADALLRRISPSIVKEEHPPKPKCKINRLRAIGNQIRFLRRLEKSIKTRERIISPSDSCPEENTDEPDSPQATSPLLLPTSPSKMRLSFCRQKRLASSTYGITAAALKPNQWQNVERNLISDDLNSD